MFKEGFKYFILTKGSLFFERPGFSGNIRAHVNFDLENFTAHGKVQIAPEGIIFFTENHLSHYHWLQGIYRATHNRPRNLLKVRSTLTSTRALQCGSKSYTWKFRAGELPRAQLPVATIIAEGTVEDGCPYDSANKPSHSVSKKGMPPSFLWSKRSP